MVVKKSILQMSCIVLLLSTVVQAEKTDAELAAEEAALLAELKSGLFVQKEKPTAEEPAEEKEAATPEPVQVTKKEKAEYSVKTSVDKKPHDVKQVKEVLTVSSETPSKKLAAPILSDTSKDKKKQVNVKNAVAENTQQPDARLTALSDKLKRREAQVEQLQVTVKQQRNDLLMAEAEVARLSNLLQRQRTTNLRSAAGLKTPLPAKPVKDARVEAQTKAQQSKMEPDMIVATVSARKANLRTGPGKNNSPLMTVSKGTRLAVETRKGEWYRVIAPSGARAWVSSSVVHFGKTRLAEPTRTLRVNGYDDLTEEDAFKLLQQSGS